MRGPDRGRRSPPLRQDDRRYQGPPPPRVDRRRGRSPSPPPYRRGSPPLPYPKRYRRDEGPYERYRGPDPFERRGPPYPPRYDDPRAYSPSPPREPQPRRMQSFKEFMMGLPEDVSAESAQSEYKVYQADYWGSEVRAEFEARRNDPSMKKRYDAREVALSLEEQKASAQQVAQSFKEQLQAGTLALDSTGPADGKASTADGSKANGTAAANDDNAALEASTAPPACWKPERVRSDLDLSHRLIIVLDAEKGITDGPFSATATAAIAAGKASTSKEPAAASQPPNGAPDLPKPTGGSADAPQPMDGVSQPPDAPIKPVDSAFDAQLKQLDLQLLYLWRAHGVDYYAGQEVFSYESPKMPPAGKPLQRCTRPEEGEQAAEGEEEQQLRELRRLVDEAWRRRLTTPNPVESSLNTEQVEKQLEDWVESQVTMLDDKKWGNKLSNKMFMGKEFVLKHIRLKHAPRVQQERERLFDDLWFARFKAEKDAQQRAAQDLEDQERARWAASQGPPAGGFEAGHAGPLRDTPYPGEGGTPRRGSGGFMSHHSGPPGLLPGASSGGLPMPGPLNRIGSGIEPPPGPVIGPGGMGPPMPGQMLVLAPGAGPLGPFISVPISEAGGRGPPPNFGPPGGGMGPPPRGMRGGGPRGGPGGPPGGPHIPPLGPRGGNFNPPRHARAYFDLDAPQNQRSVLDYGDL